MSRHRTTAKMHRVRDQPEAASPDEAEGGNPNPPEAGSGDDSAGDAALPQAALDEESLERRLAAEAAAREESELRTTDVLARYFKVTLVMVGLNMLIAGASVATLIKYASRTQTVIVTSPPPPPAPAPPPAISQAPAIETPVSPPAPSPPAKLSLLGDQLATATKPAPRPNPARSARALVMPAPKKAITMAATATEAVAPELSRSAERW